MFVVNYLNKGGIKVLSTCSKSKGVDLYKGKSVTKMIFVS